MEENPIVTDLLKFFRRLLEHTSKLPAPLAYGSYLVIAILVLVLFDAVLPANITILLGIIISACLVAFVFLEWLYRRQTDDESAEPSDDLPDSDPTLLESREYGSLRSFEEKKDLIHPKEQEIQRGTFNLSEEDIERCAGSPWEFDRIVLYIYEENSKKSNFNQRLLHVEQEVEKLRARGSRTSLVPLHYAARSLLFLIEKRSKPTKAMRASLDFIKDTLNYLEARPEIDRGGQVKNNLSKIRKALSAE